MPLISIIIPIYNIANYLTRCLNSCTNQTFPNLEILAVNDGSTDKSLQILETYAKKDNRIKIINKTNGGLNSARQAGIEACTGHYATILDGDDYLELDAIEKMVNAIEANHADIIIGGAKVVLAENYELIDKIQHEYAELYNLDYTRRIISDGPNTVCMKLYKSELIKKDTKYPNIKAGQDLPVTIQWSLNSNKVVFIPDLLYNYVVARQGSTMSGDRKIYVEAAFSAFYYTFKILTQNNKVSEYTDVLTKGTCAKLYKYLYHPHNQFRKNSKIIHEMLSFILKNKIHISGKQQRVFIQLLRINLSMAHLFVSLMQKIKPTLHVHTK